MKKVLAALALALLVGCHSNTTPPAHESAIVDNPWIFGHGGVRPYVQQSGLSWYWWSTRTVDMPTTPVRYNEPLLHVATGDNNFINYESYIVLKWQDAAHNVDKFGAPDSTPADDWYKANLQPHYWTIVRDVTKQFSMTKIMTDPPTLLAIESEIAKQFNSHIKTTGLKVALLNVNMGAARPEALVVNEMNATAAQQQRQKTEVQRKLAEDSRKAAEQARASADNAYRMEMKLDAAQFVELEAIKRYAEACSKGHCTIVQGGASVMVGSK